MYLSRNVLQLCWRVKMKCLWTTVKFVLNKCEWKGRQEKTIILHVACMILVRVKLKACERKAESLLRTIDGPGFNFRNGKQFKYLI